MNKIYKLVWSKTKNMYVAVCEYAKSHTKAPKSGVMNRAVVAGVLACVMSCSVIISAHAATYLGSEYNAGTTWATPSNSSYAYSSVTLTDADKEKIGQYLSNVGVIPTGALNSNVNNDARLVFLNDGSTSLEVRSYNGFNKHTYYYLLNSNDIASSVGKLRL